MNQEDFKEINNLAEGSANLPIENLGSEETTDESSQSVDPSEIDNLPIESIGSYARLEELLTDEEKENTTNPTAQS
jgi:hypothetical protein